MGVIMKDQLATLLGASMGFAIFFGGLSLYGWIFDIPHEISRMVFLMSTSATSLLVMLFLFFYGNGDL